VQYAKSSIEGIEVTRAAMLSILVAAIAAAQQDTPSPTFRAGTKLVEVDVIARSKGAPATGPSKDDFILLDNGKPQKIAFFSAAGSLRSPFRTINSLRSWRKASTQVRPLKQRELPEPFASWCRI
jgi:hypothetical protein